MRRLIHWASRAAADIEAVGPVWIERLAEAGDLENPSDFYALTKERLLEFERIGEVSPSRMIESIEASQRRRAAARADRAGDPDGLRGHRGAAVPRRVRVAWRRSPTPGAETLVAVEDIGPKVAASLTEHLERLRPELERLRERGVSLDVRDEDLPPQVASDAPLAGKTVVITGSIADPRSGEKVPRPAFQRLCEKAGATTASSVSANTDMLITGADVGATKTTKAEKLEVEVVDQAVIWEQLIAAGVA